MDDGNSNLAQDKLARPGQRAPAFASLIEQLTLQLQNGCGRSSCQSSICYTGRSQRTARPVRQYTHSSAKSIAITLVTNVTDCNALLCSEILADQHLPESSAAPDRIDPKSLTQQLCSTTALRGLESSLHRIKPDSRSFWEDLRSQLVQNPSPNMINSAITSVCSRLNSSESDAAHAMLYPAFGEGWYRTVILILQLQQALPSTSADGSSIQLYASKAWLGVLQIVFHNEWTGRQFISTTSIAGQALWLMEAMLKSTSNTVLDTEKDRIIPDMVETPLVYSHIKLDTACTSWLSHTTAPNTRHILSYSFLFSAMAQIEFFRTCCYQKMRQAVNSAVFAFKTELKTVSFLQTAGLKVPHDYLDRRMKLDLENYLVLLIRRDHLVKDALDQIWQREGRELSRPLRVRLGADFDEIGHDLGGVQIEFYNLLCEEMCSSNRSIFSTDPATQLCWFKMGSLEPLYRFELFGILFGLAVYNGIPLPVSFPLAFYVKLMGHPVDQTYLSDGWPDLYSGFRDLLLYKGDVESDFALGFVADMVANGLTLTVDLLSYEYNPIEDDPLDRYESTIVVNDIWEDKCRSSTTEITQLASGSGDSSKPVDARPKAQELDWPGWRFRAMDKADEHAVTHLNREDYVARYAQWILDYSVRPQFFAFAKGFYRSVDIRAVRLLSPINFQRMVEGSRDIKIDSLKSFTTYDGYTAESQCIEWYWSIVETYSQEKLRRLLEFVTASKRMPVSGTTNLRFTISEAGGENGLPRSSTCFGTLHLPKYKSKDVMETKLSIALEHSLGFGQA